MVESLAAVDSFKGILQNLLHYAYIRTFLKETLQTLHCHLMNRKNGKDLEL